MSTTEKILVIQLRQIGDVLLTTPAAASLKAKFPGCALHFLTAPPCDQVLKGNPHIDEVLVYEKSSPFAWLRRIRAERYSIVVDFLSTPRSAMLTAFSGARVKAGPGYTSSAWAYNTRFSAEGTHPYAPFQKIDFLRRAGLASGDYSYPELHISPGDSDWAGEAVNGLALGRDRIMALAPASRRITRRWPAEHYAALASEAAEKLGVGVIVLWGPGEEDLASEVADRSGSRYVRKAPRTPSLHKLSALLRRTVALVSNCSGTKHIAQASGVPTLGIYGSSRPENWTPPDDPLHQIIRNDGIDCIGCRRNDCPYDMKCLKDLSPETVFRKLSSMPPFAALRAGEAAAQ